MAATAPSRGPAMRLAGAKPLRKKLKAAGVELKDMTAAHRKVSTYVTTEAKPQAPHRTGRLKASMRPGATQKTAVMRAGSASVPYANPIHWGWPKRNIAPQPWLWHAANETEPTWVHIYLDAVEDIVQGIATGGPRP